MKIVIKNSLSRATRLQWLWLLVFITIYNTNLLAQQTGTTITVTPSSSITSSAVIGDNTASGYSTTYVLVCGGNVVASGSSPSFTAPSTAQTCTLYAVNHDSSWSPAADGSAWNAPTTECAELISRQVQVQDCLSVCANAALSAPTISGANLSGTYRLDYVLVCGSTVTANTATTDGGTGSTSFTAPATAQNCMLYAVNYDNAAGTPAYTGAANVLTVTNNTCYSLIDRCVIVDPLPAITTSATDATCAGPNTGSITISGLTASTAYTVSYTKDAGTAATSTQTADINGEIVLSNLGSGSYTDISVTNANGCVSNLETETIAPASGCTCYVACAGSTIDANVTSFNAVSPYELDFVLICDDAIASTTPSVDGTETIAIPATATACMLYAVNHDGAATYAAAGSSNDLTISGTTCYTVLERCVTVNPLPVIVIADQIICEDVTSVDLTALEPVGQTGGVWSNAGGNIATATAADPTTGPFTYTYTDANGCVGTDAVAYTINPLPTPTVGPVSNSCPLTTADLTTAITSSTTGLTVEYFESDGVTTVADATAVGQGSYVVVVTNSTTLCSTSATVVATITPCACTPATICEGEPFGLQTVEDVNNTAGYSVAMVLVCNDAVVSVYDATDVVENATTGSSSADVVDVAPTPPTTCSIWAVNYQGTGLAASDITVAAGNQITVSNFTCEEKIEKCYTINPKVTKPTVANSEVCLDGAITITPTAPAVPVPYISAILANQSTTNDANDDGTVDFCDEYVEITGTAANCDISGFTLTDNTGMRHTFPAGSIVPANGKLVVFNGNAPASTATIIYQNMSTAPSCGTGVWNNSGGDTATLLDGTMTISTASYAGAPPVGTPLTFAATTVPALYTFYSDATLSTAVASDVANLTIDGTSTPINTATAGTIDLWVVVSNACCDGDTAKLTITVNPLDDATFAFADYCEGTANGPTSIATVGGTFAFNPAVTDGATIDANTGVIAGGVGGTTYTVEYTTADVCPNTSTQDVTVNPLPTLTVGPVSNICPLTTADLTTAITSSTTGLTVEYFESDGTTAVADATAVGQGNYIVEVTNSTTLCSTSATVVVTITPCACTFTYEVCDGLLLPQLTSPPTGAPAGSNVAIGSVNTDAAYGVAFVLVCDDATTTGTVDYSIIEILSDAEVTETTVDPLTGEATGILTHVFDATTDVACQIVAINYDGTTPLVDTDIAVSPTTGEVSVTNAAITCLEKAIACVQINALPTASTVGGITNVSCNGGSDGAIDLTATGAATLSYEWDNDNVPPTDATVDLEDLTGLTAGTYNVTVTDGNGCTATTSGDVTEPTVLAVVLDAQSNPTCSGSTLQNDGSVSITASGGTSPYTYDWSNDGAETPDNDTDDLTGLAATTSGTSYTVTITDANGCATTTSVTLTAPTCASPCTANVSDIPDNTICEADVSQDNNLAFPLEPYNAIYGPAPTPAADYTLVYVLTDNSDNVLAAEIMGAPFNTVSNTPSFAYSNLAAGTYRMYEIIYRTSDGPLTGITFDTDVTTVDGTIAGIGMTTGTCLDATYGNIYINAAPNATAQNDGPICVGESVTLVAGGGINYEWSHGPTTVVDTESPSATTTYTVTVTSSDGCIATATTEVIVNPLPTPTVADVAVCPGASATLDNTQGFSGYAWSTGAVTNSITVSPSTTTTYTLTVTDSNGCRGTTSATVTILSPTASITPANPIITCANNGEVVLTAGPSGAVSYAWSGPGIVSGGNTEAATVNAAGTYVVTVTSGTAPNTCTATASVVVGQDISQPLAFITTPQGTALSCTVSSVNLVANFFPVNSTVVWTLPDATTASSSTLSASQTGTYTVVVTASNGCTNSATVDVTSNNTVTVSIATPATLTCTTASTQLSATAVGASNYSWTAANGGNIVSGATTATPTVNAAGDYTVVVTNGSCSSTATVTVSANTTAPQTVSAGSDVVLDCTTSSTTLTATSGTAGVTFAWTTPSGLTSTSNPLTNVTQAGNYTVVVTDPSNGCTASDIVNVSIDTTAPGATIATPDGTVLDCVTNNVDLTVNTTGTILWSTNETTATINVTSGGTYSVVTTGANGCTSSASVNVSTIASLNVNATVTNALCNGGTGSINVNVSGGTGSYTYAWSNAETSQDLSGVVAGTYTLTVTDANNTTCTVEVSQTITEPVRIGITVDSTTPATCGTNNGTISISVTGGTPGYTYFWTNGATTQDLTGLAAGTYFVIVSDANGCSTSASAQVTTPSGLTVDLGPNGVTDAACNGDATGAIDVSVVGGSAPYTYAWSNGETTEDLSNLAAGNYDLTVTDAANCQAVLFATVGEPAALNLTTTVADEICNDGSIDLSVSGGKGPYTYLWSDGSTTQDLSGLNAGTYTVTVTDFNNCIITTSVDVSQTPIPTNNDGPTCEGGTITIGFGTFAHPGETVNYAWSGPNSYTSSGSFVSTGQDVVTANLNNLQLADAGIYTVTVTFANGCTRTAQTNVKVDGKPLIDPVVTCNGSLGTITMNAESVPSNNGVEYSFNGGAYIPGTGVFTGLSNGDYTISVLDPVSLCVTTTTLTVNCACPTPIASNTGPLCVGSTGLQLSVNPNLPAGVTATYLWTKQGSTATSTAQNPSLGTATINKAGTYTVQVTYSNGCIATASTIVVVNALPTATAVASCAGGPGTGVITVTANSNPVGNGVQYAFDGGIYGNSNVATGLSNGIHTVSVRDNVTGCVRTLNVTVSCTTCPTATASNNSPVCAGSSVTLSVALSNLNGTTATSYAWSGPAGTSNLQSPTILNMTPAKVGNYCVTVTFANGCTATSCTNISLNPTPTISLNTTCDPTLGGIISVSSSGGSGLQYNIGEGPQGSGVFIDLSNGTYTITVTNSSGCSNTATTTVNCQTCQASTGIVSISGGVCDGEHISATAIFNSPTTGYANYLLLTDDAGNILEVAAGPSVTFTGTAVAGTSYNVYAYSVKTPSGGPNPPAVGTNVADITGTCYDLSDTNQTANVIAPPPMYEITANTQEGNNGGVSPFEYNTDVITIEGGTLPYDFTWENTGYVRYDIVYGDVDSNGDGTSSPGATITIYYTDDAQWNVTVTDESGCANNQVISTNDFGTGNAILDIDSFETTSCSDITGADGSIILDVSGGDCGNNYSYEWYGPAEWDGSGLTPTTNGTYTNTGGNNYVLDGLPSGWYAVTVTCGDQTTEGWYWVAVGTRGRAKVDMSMMSIQPNPFAEQTMINFMTEGATTAKVLVYAADGKLVNTLFNGKVTDKQNYSLPFRAENLPSGVYVVQLVTDNGVTKFEKLIIAR